MRKCFVWKNRYFELDTYIEPKLGMQILELEGVKEGDEVEMPPFIKVIEDITGNETYYNYQLSLRWVDVKTNALSKNRATREKLSKIINKIIIKIYFV